MAESLCPCGEKVWFYEVTIYAGNLEHVPAHAGGGVGIAPGRLSLGNWFLVVLGAAVLVISALILNFFRDFERNPERALKPKEILAPADGKVVVLKKAVEKFYLKKPSVHIAIFMNPLNNHVQRAPFDGKVVKRVYHPGEFMAAYEDKADLVNEQAHLVVDLKTPGKKGKTAGRIVLKQIAGFLCRRVRTTPEAGDGITREKELEGFCWAREWMCSCPKALSPP